MVYSTYMECGLTRFITEDAAGTLAGRAGYNVEMQCGGVLPHAPSLAVPHASAAVSCLSPGLPNAVIRDVIMVAHSRLMVQD